MFDEQNKTNESNYGQSDTGYGQSDTYQPPVQPKSPEAPAPAVEPEILSSVTAEPQPTRPEKAEPETVNGAEQPQAPGGQQSVNQGQPNGGQSGTYYAPDGTPRTGYQGQQPYGQQNGGYQGQPNGGQNGTYYAPDGTPRTGYQGQQPNGQQNGGYQSPNPYSQQPYYGNQPPYQNRGVYGRPFNTTKDTFGIIGLVCGIFSVLACCCGGLPGIVLGIFGIVFACMSKTRNYIDEFTGLGRAALILGIIGIVFGVFNLAVALLVPQETIDQILNEYSQNMTGYSSGWDV